MGRLRGLGEGISPSLPADRNFLHYFLRTPLGINLAGVEVILRLSDQMSELHHCLGGLAGELRELLEAEDSK